MADPLQEALRDATLAVLLGATSFQQQIADTQGGKMLYTVTIPSAFCERIRARAHKGEFDTLIDAAIDKITADDLAETLKTVLTEQMLKGLETDTRNWNAPKPGWLQDKVRSLAVAAATNALAKDAMMMEILRTRVGMEVDRNRVGITVQLTDPEK